MNKGAVITLLLVLNAALAAILVLGAYSPPAAMAQGIGRSGEFILVAAEAEMNNDALYLVDLRTMQMHAFRTTMPGVEPVAIGLVGSRDLARDFRR